MRSFASVPAQSQMSRQHGKVVNPQRVMEGSLRSLLTVMATVMLLVPCDVAFSQPPPMAVVSPELGPRRMVTFRLLAPNAREVSVNGEFTREAIPMTKDDKGVWSVTVGPLRPDVYGYAFRMDGLNLPDPCNTFVRVGSLAFES
jgi:hypothetical protein